MSKEELEKEADKWLVNNLHSTEEDYKQAYLAGAEPREKRIEHLEESLLDVTEKSVKRIAELEAQIEKMKCCSNCQTVRDAEGNCYLKKDGKCKDKDKWELRR